MFTLSLTPKIIFLFILIHSFKGNQPSMYTFTNPAPNLPSSQLLFTNFLKFLETLRKKISPKLTRLNLAPSGNVLQSFVTSANQQKEANHLKTTVACAASFSNLNNRQLKEKKLKIACSMSKFRRMFSR